LFLKKIIFLTFVSFRQLSIHKNIPKLNQLWKELKYFHHQNYATRLGTAYRMLTDRIPSDEVFKKNFHSAEGWYSQLVFGNDQRHQLRVKIVGRAFDDFYREPVVLFNGRLYRCPLTNNLASCIKQLHSGGNSNTVNNNRSSSSASNTNNNSTSTVMMNVFSLPPVQFIDAQSYKDSMACKMYWLPVEAREW
jgi:hypothetical protein